MAKLLLEARAKIEALEAENAAKDRRIAELEKRPVLEADVLASFSTTASG